MIKLYILLATAVHEAAPATHGQGGLIEGIQTTVEQVGLNWQHLLSQIIVFGLVAFCLKRFAFDPVFKVLDERRAKIEESLRNSERIKAELVEAETSRKEILRKANEQADSVVSEARKIASSQGERLIADAQAQAEQIVKRAQEEAVRERERMLVDLKREVGRLVIDTTAKVTGKVLSPEDQRRLNEEAKRQLAATN
jgi:F-type H+-transporting ATPase subunit b